MSKRFNIADLYAGHKVRITSWPANVYLFLVPANTPPNSVVFENVPDNVISVGGWMGVRGQKWIAMHTIDKCVVVWHPTQAELLSDQWEIVDQSSTGFSEMLQNVQ